MGGGWFGLVHGLTIVIMDIDGVESDILTPKRKKKNGAIDARLENGKTSFSLSIFVGIME